MGANQRYNIKVNPPKPTAEEVNKHKDFNRILSQYNRKKTRKPLHHVVYKVNKLVPIIIVTILIMLIVFYYSKFKNKMKQNPQPKSETTQMEKPESSLGFSGRLLRL